MAVTDIQATVLANTGRTPTANSVEDAQKFVVSSIPKDLLKWAASETVPATHGGDNDPQQVTLPVGTDSVISVRRDSYVAEEASVQERGFIGNSSSLKKATNVFPKYFIADGNRVITKPDPDSTYKIYVMYVDFSKLDDDCDLRNAVINYASSKEFSALAVSSSRVSAIQSQIAEYTAKLQSAQAEFGADLQDYQARLAETVQLNQGQISEWQAENGVKLSHYIQMSSQYYNWAAAEIKSYIENNTKTLEKVIELQRGK